VKNTSGLKPFKPGQSGNPSGRPSKRPITDRYFEQLAQPVPAHLVARFNRSCHAKLLNVGDTWGHAIAISACFEAAFSSSIRAMREIRESIEGKAPQRLEITGAQRSYSSRRPRSRVRPVQVQAGLRRGFDESKSQRKQTDVTKLADHPTAGHSDSVCLWGFRNGVACLMQATSPSTNFSDNLPRSWRTTN
jgi:Family of unknown function (DUF5681)